MDANLLERVCVEVLGWTRKDDFYGKRYWLNERGVPLPGLMAADGNLFLRVVEAMQENGFGDWTIMRENEIDRVTVCFGPGEGAMSDDPVEATCLAALRALENGRTSYGFILGRAYERGDD